MTVLWEPTPLLPRPQILLAAADGLCSVMPVALGKRPDGPGLTWCPCCPLFLPLWCCPPWCSVMPEALEKWPVKVLAKLLPRHIQLIEQVNDAWLASITDFVSAKVAAELAAAPEPEPTEEPTTVSEAAKTEAAEEEEAVDTVAEALKAYSIIQENPWNKGEL